MRQALKNIVDFFIYSNLIVALGAALFIWETYLLLGSPVQIKYILLGFAATLFVYNIDRLIDSNTEAQKSERHIWISKNAQFLKLLSALSAAYVLLAIFYTPFKIILFLAHLALISILYSVPFIRVQGKWRSLRSIKGIKLFLISYVWLAATVVMPALASGHRLFDTNMLLLALERGFFIFAITLPFDIRDYENDLARGLFTIPMLVGIRSAKNMALAFVLLSGFISFIHYPLYSASFWAKEISVVSTFVFLSYLSERQHEYYFTGLLDGTIIIQFLLVMLFRACS